MGEEGTTRAGAFEKYAKAFASIAVGIGALVSLLSASRLIDAKQKELDYEKSLFELSAVPYATSQLEVTAIRTNEICELSGSVAVKNAGKYPILIDSVIVKVWQLPPTPAIGEMAWQDLSISRRIKDLEFRPLELSGPNILLGPEEEGGKEFRARFKVDDLIGADASFVVYAELSGGRTTASGQLDERKRFPPQSLYRMKTLSCSTISPFTAGTTTKMADAGANAVSLSAAEVAKVRKAVRSIEPSQPQQQRQQQEESPGYSDAPYVDSMIVFLQRTFECVPSLRDKFDDTLEALVLALTQDSDVALRNLVGEEGVRCIEDKESQRVE